MRSDSGCENSLKPKPAARFGSASERSGRDAPPHHPILPIRSRMISLQWSMARAISSAAASEPPPAAPSRPVKPPSQPVLAGLAHNKLI